MSGQKRQYTFGRNHRLAGRVAFSSVFELRVRTSKGPLTAYARPNELGRWRLGISIGRKAGNAVRRNRIKRLLREAFRLEHQDWPGAIDMAVVVRGHQPSALADYQQMLTGMALRLHTAWQKRQEPSPPRPAGEAPTPVKGAPPQ